VVTFVLWLTDGAINGIVISPSRLVEYKSITQGEEYRVRVY